MVRLIEEFLFYDSEINALICLDTSTTYWAGCHLKLDGATMIPLG